MIIGSNFISVRKLTSTNTYLAELIKGQDVPEGTVVTTGFQTGGRGQAGNKWESEDGKNLLFSTLIRPPEISADEQFLISMIISLGVCDFAERFVPAAFIKWPNDIYINNDKIAGILIENSILGNITDYSVAGVGFNINQENFVSEAPNPVSLKMATGKDYDIDDCLRKAVADLDKRYKQLIAGNFSEIRDNYTGKLYRYLEWSEYSGKEGSFTGKIRSVTPQGLLLIERRSGKTESYAFKEIDFIL